MRIYKIFLVIVFLATEADGLKCNLMHVNPCFEFINSTAQIRVITCANNGPVRLECAVGKTILIQSALWGRQNDTHCKNDQSGRVQGCEQEVSSLPCNGTGGKCSFPLRGATPPKRGKRVGSEQPRPNGGGPGSQVLKDVQLNRGPAQRSSSETDTEKNGKSFLMYNGKCLKNLRGDLKMQLEETLYMDIKYTCVSNLMETATDLTSTVDPTKTTLKSSTTMQRGSRTSTTFIVPGTTSSPGQFDITLFSTTGITSITRATTTVALGEAQHTKAGLSEAMQPTTTTNSQEIDASGMIGRINDDGGKGVPIGIAVASFLVLIGVIVAVVFILWQRRIRTRYVKEDEAVYVPTHPDDMAPPTKNTNLTNPTYDKQGVDNQEPEKHEYDYIRLGLDVETGSSDRRNQPYDPQYASVKENSKKMTSSTGVSATGTQSGGFPRPSQYETIYPDDAPEENHTDDTKYPKGNSALTQQYGVNTLETNLQSSSYETIYPGDVNEQNYVSDTQYSKVNKGKKLLSQKHEANLVDNRNVSQYDTIYPNNENQQNNVSDTQYSEVNKGKKLLTQQHEVHPVDNGNVSQYETVYPDESNHIYDAEYGAVEFTENDIYHH